MIEPLIKHLQQYASLKDSIEVERFDATLGQIAGLNDPRAIGLLIPLFNDNCKFPEVMFSIIHTIERFDDETYVREILKTLPTLLAKSPYWANVIHFRIFNHPPSRQTYRQWLEQADSETKAAAKALLTTMRAQEPKFVQACDEMLAVLAQR